MFMDLTEHHTVSWHLASNKRPSVALLITCFNRRDKLRRAIESTIPESHLFDIFLVDDGSDIPLNETDLLGLSGVVVRLHKNTGASSAANAGLTLILSSGYTYVARLDSDDQVEPGRFQRQLSFVEQNPFVGLLGGQFRVVRPDGSLKFTSQHPLGDIELKRALYVGNVIHHPTWLARCDLFSRSGLYDPSLVAGEDYDLCWRLSRLTTIRNLPDVVLTYEQGGNDSLSTLHRRTQAVNALRIKLRWFNAFSIYSYIGIVFSVADISGVLPYIRWLTRPVMSALFRRRK